MPRSILIIDANPGFAGMLDQAFTGAGFSCAPALTAEEAVRIASSQPIDLAIVDFHIPDASVRDLVRALRALQPSAILLGIPLDNNPDNPILDELGMQGGLFKPFYLPSLVPYIATILGETLPPHVIPHELPAPPPEEIARPTTRRSTRHLPWLNDAGYLAEVLDQTAAENPVVACMVTRGTQLCAWAGSLTREQLSLVARKVADSWADNSGGSLTRYIHVPLTLSDVYLYSTSLTVDLDLSLLFDQKTPLSVTRQRALNFLKALERNPGRTPGKIESSSTITQLEDATLAEEPTGEPAQSDGSIQDQIDALFQRNRMAADEYLPSHRKPIESSSRLPIPPKKKETPLEPFVAPALTRLRDIDHIRAEDIEEQVPPEGGLPDLRSQHSLERELSEQGLRETIESADDDDPAGASSSANPPRTADGSVRIPRRSLSDAMERRLHKEVFRFDGAPPPNPMPMTTAADLRPAMEEQPRVRMETLSVDNGLANREPIPSGFESPSPALVKLTYAIVLTPTFPGARLSPEMAADLESFLRNVAVSYGWKALRIVVQSGFLAANITAPPHVAPAFVIRIMRRHSSKRLLERFPALAEANASPDFWAPGYLLIGTDQPPTPQQVTDYIAYTRRAQGFGPATNGND
jgi:CheY-like chemotaxis protein/REP element-mobilizing transposase RayT